MQATMPVFCYTFTLPCPRSFRLQFYRRRRAFNATPHSTRRRMLHTSYDSMLYSASTTATKPFLTLVQVESRAIMRHVPS